MLGYCYANRHRVLPDLGRVGQALWGSVCLGTAVSGTQTVNCEACSEWLRERAGVGLPARLWSEGVA